MPAPFFSSKAAHDGHWKSSQIASTGTPSAPGLYGRPYSFGSPDAITPVGRAAAASAGTVAGVPVVSVLFATTAIAMIPTTTTSTVTAPKMRIVRSRRFSPDCDAARAAAALSRRFLPPSLICSTPSGQEIESIEKHLRPTVRDLADSPVNPLGQFAGKGANSGERGWKIYRLSDTADKSRTHDHPVGIGRHLMGLRPG